LSQLAEQLIADVQDELGRRAMDSSQRRIGAAGLLEILQRRHAIVDVGIGSGRRATTVRRRILAPPERIALAEQGRGRRHGFLLAEPISFEQHAG
jgi:hypothetical protein